MRFYGMKSKRFYGQNFSVTLILYVWIRILTLLRNFSAWWLWQQEESESITPWLKGGVFASSSPCFTGMKAMQWWGIEPGNRYKQLLEEIESKCEYKRNVRASRGNENSNILADPAPGGSQNDQNSTLYQSQVHVAVSQDLFSQSLVYMKFVHIFVTKMQEHEHGIQNWTKNFTLHTRQVIPTTVTQWNQKVETVSQHTFVFRLKGQE